MNIRERLAGLQKKLFYTDLICFREITTENDLIYAVIDFQLSPEQQDLVNPAGFSIGRAYLRPNENVPYLICALENGEERPVGFILLCKFLGGDGQNTS